MARYKHSANPAIRLAEFFAKASSRKYRALTRNASSNEYCRTSAASRMIGGRNATKRTPIRPARLPAALLSHLWKIQQKAAPASTEGIRSQSSEVPSARQQ